MNLNELQAEYWEKILHHLYEENDLEPILSHLLPSIDSQEVLDRLYNFCKINPDTESFSVRVRRIKTLWASLSNDWFIIQDRLEHFKPTSNFENIQHSLISHFQNIQQNKNRQKNKGKVTYTFDDEIIDMLYALNLSEKIYIPTTLEEWQDYKTKERVETCFKLLKCIFSSGKQNDNLTWKTNFPSIRALCCLMEKSPDLEMPFSLYLQLLNEYSEKDILYPFFLERLFVIAQRIQIYELNNTELLENVQRFETKFKKDIQKFSVDNVEFNPPILKYVSEILKSILAISPKENSILQQLEREETKEKERLKAERLAKEEAQRLETECVTHKAQKRLGAAERIARKEQEQSKTEEHIAQEQQQRIEAERVEHEHLAQVEAQHFCSESENITQQTTVSKTEIPVMTQPITPTVPSSAPTTAHLNFTPAPLFEMATRKATTEFVLFGLRIFVSRVHQRMNIEDINTGERWSLQLNTQHIQSDWQYQQQQNVYHISVLRINIIVLSEYIHIQHLEYGVSTQIQL